MSRATEARDLLQSAAQKLDELAPCLNGPGEEEESGQIQKAAQTEEEAQQAPTAGQMAELATEAEQLRQLAKTGMGARASNANGNMDTALAISGEIREAVEGTPRGDEMVTAIGQIYDLIEESKMYLSQAAEMATQREQTQDCLGLFAKAGEHAEQAAKLCLSLKEDIDQYVAAL